MMSTEINLALLGLGITLVLTIIIQLVYYIINKSDERKRKQQKFIRILRKNGFKHIRDSGSHNIYESPKGKHISVPHHLALLLLKDL